MHGPVFSLPLMSCFSEVPHCSAPQSRQLSAFSCAKIMDPYRRFLPCLWHCIAHYQYPACASSAASADSSFPTSQGKAASIASGTPTSSTEVLILRVDGCAAENKL